MTMLKPMKYNNTYALAVKRDFAKENNIKTIGDLQRLKIKLNQGSLWNLMIDLMVIKLWRKLMVSTYLMLKMEPKLRYTAVEKGDINLIDAYSTDAELKQYNMVVLKDDKHVFPPYQGAPMFKEKFLKQHPEIKTAQQIRGKISDEEMQEMNYKVTVKMKIRIMLRNIILKKKV